VFADAGRPPIRWRVSIAQLDALGPFSDFAGYARKLVLLRGRGVRLTPLAHLRHLATSPAGTTLLLPVSGAVTIAGAAGPGPLVFFATLEDNSR
jgi:hypothetical protein